MIKELLHADGTITPLTVPAGNGHVAKGNAENGSGPRCRQIAPHEIGDVLHSDHPDDVLYLDIEKPTEADLDFLRDKFRFHALAIEDIEQSGQRPKVDDYGTFVHVVMYAVDYTVDELLQTHEVDLFYSDRYLVTVHHDPVPALAEAVHRWQRNTDILGNGVGALIYAVLDSLVDSYFPVLDEIQAAGEAAEERVFAQQRGGRTADDTVEFLFARRKELQTLRRVIVPARDVTATISRRALAHLHAEIGPYVTDVNDHVIRIVETIDDSRDLLDSAMQAALATQSNTLNNTVKTMTASTILIMVPTLIAGIYGMNFHNMPELGWEYGYPYALLLMGICTGIVAYLFRRARWI